MQWLNDLVIISSILGTILPVLFFMVKLFLKHKMESDRWKRDHSERLAKVEGKLEIIGSGKNE